MIETIFEQDSFKSSLIPGTFIGTIGGSRFLEQINIPSPINIQYEFDIPNSILNAGAKIRGIVIPSGIASLRQNQLVQAIREHYKSEYMILTFDYIGLSEMGGGSLGPLQLHCLGQMINDLNSVLKIFSDEKIKSVLSDIVLFGPSAAGNVIANIESGYLPISGRVFLGTPTDFYTFKDYFPHDDWDKDGYKIHRSKSTGQDKRFHRNLWDKSNERGFNLVKNENILEPMLVIGGEDDDIVLEDKLVHPNRRPLSKRIMIPGDHNYTNSKGELFRVIDEFLAKIPESSI